MRIIPSSRQSLSFEWLAVNKVCEFKTMTIPSTKMNHSSIVTIQNFSDYQYNGNANFPSPGQWWWKSAPANFHGEAEIWIPLTTGCAARIMLRESVSRVWLEACLRPFVRGDEARCWRPLALTMTGAVSTPRLVRIWLPTKGRWYLYPFWKAFPGRKRRSGQVIHAHKL